MKEHSVEASPQVLSRIGTLAALLFPAILLPAFVGEASLCLWLLVKGVNVEQWKQRAGVQPARSTAATVPG